MPTHRGSTTVRTEEHNSYFQAGYNKRAQYVNFSSTVTKSDILDEETSLVEVFSTQDCWISVIGYADTPPTPPGAEKTVVENIKRQRGGITGFIGIPPNITSPVIAVVWDGVDGTIDILEYE